MVNYRTWPVGTEAESAAGFKLMTVDEACRVYRIGTNRLRNAIKAGELPVIMMGRRITIRPQVIEDWLVKQESYRG